MRFSVWLLPDAASRAALEPLLAAARGRRPRFAPHLTIGSATGAIDAALVRHVRAQSPSASAVVLRVVRVRTGRTWSRSIFLELAPSRALERLTRRMLSGPLADANAPPFPHVSLAYGAPAGERRRLATRLRGSGLPRRLAFDAVAIARTGRGPESSHDVRDWRTVRRIRLAARTSASS